MKKAIIAADLHLLKKPGLWAGRAEIAGDDLWGLECVEALRKQHDADLYLLGDTLDTPTNLPRPLVALQAVLGEAAKAGRVFFLDGQHDLSVGSAFDQAPWLTIVSGAKCINEKSFEFMGMKAFGLSYFPAPFEGLALSKVPEDTEVLMLHATIDAVMPMNFHFSQESLKKFKKLKHVLAGDYHMPIDLVVGSCTVQYCGSTYMNSITEPRDKSVILLEQTATGIKTTRLPIPTRTIVMLSEVCNAAGIFDSDKLKAWPTPTNLPEELKTPVILVDMPTDKDMYTKLAEFGHVRSTSAANPDTPTQAVIDMAEKLTNEEILANYADREKNPAEFAFTLDVIENSVEDAINRLRENMGIKLEDRTIQQVQTSEVNLEEENPDDETEGAV